MTSRSPNPAPPPPPPSPSPATGVFQFSHCVARDQAELLQLYHDTFKLTQPMLLQLTGLPLPSQTKLRQGQTPFKKHEKALTELDQLLTALCLIMQPTDIGPWFGRPNPAFDGRSPLHLVQAREKDRILGRWILLQFQ